MKICIILLSILFVTPAVVFTAPTGPDARFGNGGGAKGAPISSVLNNYGSIKRGVSGSFDAKGFRIVTGREGAAQTPFSKGNKTALPTPRSLR